METRTPEKNIPHLPAGAEPSFRKAALPLKSSIWVSPDLLILDPDPEVALLLPNAEEVYHETGTYRQLNPTYAAWLLARMRLSAKDAPEPWLAERRERWAEIQRRAPSVFAGPLPALYSYRGPGSPRRLVTYSEHIDFEIGSRVINLTTLGAFRPAPAAPAVLAAKPKLYAQSRVEFTTRKKRRKKS